MPFRPLMVLALLAFAGFSHARIADTAPADSIAAKADAQAQRITDVTEFLDELDDALGLARDGGYGNIRSLPMSRMEAAREEIGGLLQGRQSASELSPDQRIALYNAHQVIVSTLRNEDKSRMVCTRAEKTGSRLPKTECLSIADREARARANENNVQNAQRQLCVPGEAGLCVQ